MDTLDKICCIICGIIYILLLPIGGLYGVFLLYVTDSECNLPDAIKDTYWTVPHDMLTGNI